MSLTYGDLLRTHNEYDHDEWCVNHALYAGGRTLLRNPHVMKRVFYRQPGEEDEVFNERLRRAFYICIAGQVVDAIVAALFGDQLKVECKGLDKFWPEFVADVSDEGGERITLRQLLRMQITTALIKRRAWTLVELPGPGEMPDSEEPKSKADEEAMGRDRAYACVVAPECVRDWRVDRRGELEYVLIRSQDSAPLEPFGRADIMREEWTLYTRDEWMRWSFAYPKDKPPEPKKELTELANFVESSGQHTFGKVPLRRLELPEGLHAMGKLSSLAIEHLNKLNAKSWGEYKGLHQFLAFFQSPARPGDPVSENINRHVSQTVGPGRAWRGTGDDRIEVIAPDVAPFAEARASLSELEERMLRVVHQMSQGVENSAAALGRSGLSKAMDRASEAVVLTALGQHVKEHAADILETAAAGRKEVEDDWDERVTGMDSYEDLAIVDLVTNQALLETIPVPSQTFQAESKKRLARLWLGRDVDDEKLAQIDAEIDLNTTIEQMMPVPVGGGPTDGVDPEDGTPIPVDEPPPRTTRMQRPPPAGYASPGMRGK